MFEHKTQPIIPFPRFVVRMLQHLGMASSFIIASLIIGVVGYHFCAGLGWVDSFYNASLILSGMGPANMLESVTGKIFASFYALFSGLLVIAATGFLLAPLFHRVIHTLHVDKPVK